MLESGLMVHKDVALERRHRLQSPSVGRSRIRPLREMGPMLAVVCILVACALLPGTGHGAPPFDRDLDAIVKRHLPPGFAISLQVVELDSGKILMEKNPDLPLVPASTMKVVTTAAALATLKPDFTFVTQVLADEVRGHSVRNIFLKGFGDPYLVSEQMFVLTRNLRDKGLEEIRGSIVVDDSYFIPGKPLDENEKLGHRAYHAPYSALSLNFNAMKIVVTPAEKAGRPATVTVDPVSEYAVVDGHVQTVKGQKPAEIEITKVPQPDGREVVQVRGTIGALAAPKGRYVNVDSPALYAGGVFKEFLLREGVRVTGKVMRGGVPESAESYLEFNSHPLGTLVYWLNKFSNNFMAEQICMAVGAQVYGAPGTREKGLEVSRRFLHAHGVDEGLFSLTEASGLSRNNQVAASVLVRVLRNAARDFSYGPEFMASLGVAGVDGTMKEKLNDPKAKRRIRAKTGTLRGVNAMAGYGLSPQGKAFVFAALVNSQQKGTGLIDYADNIIREVLNVSFDSR
jgi:serine-type D-Ala-D-Ala carboxypeptidase/endopeptidase (penicillin-binding protein 4)